MSVLEQICARKKEHVKARKAQTSTGELKAKLHDYPPTRGFIKIIQERMTKGAPALIAEVKKASPSKGLIREDFNPAIIARAYEAGGAACLSVLTDEPYFQGHDDYLLQACAACSLPVLRKDFMVDNYQLYESRALGADCILLIMAALEDTQAADFYGLAAELGMDVLVEVHDGHELERALRFNPHMIGVNNRNLKTLDVDTATSHALRRSIPESVIRVAESGIHNHADLASLFAAGYNAFLVGESLMSQPDITGATRALLNTKEAGLDNKSELN